MALSRFARQSLKRAARSSAPSARPTWSGTALPIWRCICCRFRETLVTIHEETDSGDVAVDGIKFKGVGKPLRPRKFANCDNPPALRRRLKRKIHNCILLTYMWMKNCTLSVDVVSDSGGCQFEVHACLAVGVIFVVIVGNHRLSSSLS